MVERKQNKLWSIQKILIGDYSINACGHWNNVQCVVILSDPMTSKPDSHKLKHNENFIPHSHGIL